MERKHKGGALCKEADDALFLLTHPKVIMDVEAPDVKTGGPNFSIAWADSKANVDLDVVDTSGSSTRTRSTTTDGFGKSTVLQLDEVAEELSMGFEM